MAVCILFSLFESISNDGFSLDAEKTPYMTEFASCWGLLLGSMLIASPVICFKVKESTAIEEDLRFSDETTADVFGGTVEGTDVSDKPQAHQDASSKA